MSHCGLSLPTWRHWAGSFRPHVVPSQSLYRVRKKGPRKRGPLRKVDFPETPENLRERATVLKPRGVNISGSLRKKETFAEDISEDLSEDRRHHFH